MLNKKGVLLLPSYGWQWLLLLFSSATFAQISTVDNFGSIAKEKTEITQHFNQLSHLIKENPNDGIALFHTQEEAYSNHPNTYAKARILVASAYGELMEYQKAHLIINSVLSSPIDSTTYYNGLYQKGSFYYKEKKLIVAFKTFQKCKAYFLKKDVTFLKKTNEYLVANLLRLGNLYEKLNQDSFELFLLKAEEIVCQPNFSNDDNKANVLFTLGAHYARSYDTLKAFQRFDEASAIKVSFQELLYQNIAFEKGLIYGKLGLLDASMKQHETSLDIATKLKDNYTIYSNITSIGHLFFDMANYKNAKAYYQKGYDFAHSIRNSYLSGNALTNLGNIYVKTKEYETAIAYYQNSLLENDSLQNKNNIIKNNLGIAQAKKGLGILGEAYNYNKKAYSMAKTLGFKEELANSAALFSAIAFELKNYSETIQKSKEVLALKAHISQLELISTYQNLSKAYEAKNGYQAALKYHQLLKTETDNYFNTEKIKAFAEMEARFQNEKITIENQHLKSNQAQNQIIIQQRTWLAIATAFGLILLAIIAWVLAQRNKQKQLINQLLKKEVKSKNARLKQTHLQLEHSNHNAKSLEKLVVEKDSKLATKIAELTKFNKQVEKIEGEISVLMEAASDADKKTLYQLKRKLQSIQLIDSNYLKEFNLSLKNYDPEFFQKLIKNHPNLTQNELNHCAFIRLNMTIKEVADLMNITEDSVKKARYRLKKKIGLTVKIDLKKHLIGM